MDGRRVKKMYSNFGRREGESVPPENMMDATDCESDLKLNDMFEFTGVLAFDTDVKDDKRGENEMENCFDEEESVNLPSCKPKPDLLRGIRESLLRHLTVVLGDDELAAHFMLLHILSKVHLRVDSVAVGKLSLNLIGFDKSMKDYETNSSSFPSNSCGLIRKHRCRNVGCMEMVFSYSIINIFYWDKIQKVVEDDMVSARQVDQSLGTEDFNKLDNNFTFVYFKKYDNFLDDAKYICLVDDDNKTFKVQEQEFAPFVVSHLLKQYWVYKVVGACHGLLCLYGFHKCYKEWVLLIWNPSIGKSFGIAASRTYNQTADYWIDPLTVSYDAVSIGVFLCVTALCYVAMGNVHGIP
nr:mini-chromosome maintenance complex-binding protein [Tanacetum cinerariifolium]